ncbi:MAG: DUF3159 domain-containing protein [Actinomycetes bacterium]
MTDTPQRREFEDSAAPSPFSAGADVGGNNGDAPKVDADATDRVLEVTVGSAFETGLASALGGVRGVIDSGIPSLVFVLDFLLRNRNLTEAAVLAVASAVIVTTIRLIRRESAKQALSGVVGVAFSAGLAYFTGQARNYFASGIVLNAVYGTGLLITILIGKPAVGYISSALAGDIQWRENEHVRRKMVHATWLWVAVFYVRIAIQLPLYLQDRLAGLGVVKLALGWPLYLLAVGATWSYLRPHRSGLGAQETAAYEGEDTPSPTTSSTPTPTD